MLTSGLLGLGHEGAATVMKLIRTYDQFEVGSDPFRQHDFGSVVFAGQQVFWKIDYYDATLEFGSPDPADSDVTARVITIMLASEY